MTRRKGTPASSWMAGQSFGGRVVADVAVTAEVTAETITDDQIRELNASTHDLTVRGWCMAALRVPLGKRSIESRARARAKCAEIIVRAKSITADTITFEQICKLRDELESDLGAAQIATGYYESGTPVRDPDRQHRARARCAALINARSK